MTTKATFRSYVSNIVVHPLFTHTVMALILINSVIVGLETIPKVYQSYHQWLVTFDRILLWLFTVEIVIRFIAEKRPSHFFKNGWNVFDFIIVAGGHLFAGAHFVTVLRILRVLRLLRTISVVPSLRRLVNALLWTIPSLGNILLLMSLIFYIFAVMGTMLFADVAPEYFGSLPLSLLTLFQVVTLESWASGVMRPIFEQVAWAWVYFVAFILVGTFVIFNLFVGVIVSNVEKAEQKEKEEMGEEKTVSAQELSLLRQEIAELKRLIENGQAERSVSAPVSEKE
mgnify:CR=1 FL=1